MGGSPTNFPCSLPFVDFENIRFLLPGPSFQPGYGFVSQCCKSTTPPCCKSAGGFLGKVFIPSLKKKTKQKPLFAFECVV